METPKTIEERKQEVIEGPFGRTLLSVKGCIVYGRDENRPDMDEDVLYFELQRSCADLTGAQIDDFIAMAERIADAEGLTIKYEYRRIGKGGFIDIVSKIQIVVQV